MDHGNGISRRAWLTQAAAGGIALGLGGRAWAQADWPKGPIKLIVPYAPGGVNDIVMRLVSKQVGERVGQPVIIDNRPGAGGVVGTTAVAKSPADGYTLGAAATSTLIASPLTNPQSTVDVQKELAFVSILATVPMFLTVNTDLPVNNAADLLKYVQANKGKLNYGSMAVGHFGHVTLMEMSEAQGAGMVHSPYKGEAPLLQDLIGNQIQMAMVTPAAVKGMAEGGRVKLLGVSGTRRLKAFPNVPTLAEQGFTNPLYQMSAGWMGIIAPAGTPAPILQRLSTEFAAAVKIPEIADQMSALGVEPMGTTSEQFAATYARERPLWRDLLQKAGVQVRA
ncbi:MAG: tripartite tricarboxylate transporter substrate binding protein [Comamonadaceae bacterium]|nr:MAG: tripartite tricarboxylate transporter substrate binding protein [Comamonadaceae bacterium]